MTKFIIREPAGAGLADRNLAIARRILNAQRDLDEAMYHVLTPGGELGLAVMRGRLVDAAGHAIGAAQEALRGDVAIVSAGASSDSIAKTSGPPARSEHRPGRTAARPETTIQTAAGEEREHG